MYIKVSWENSIFRHKCTINIYGPISARPKYFQTTKEISYFPVNDSRSIHDTKHDIFMTNVEQYQATATHACTIVVVDFSK